MSEQLSSFDAAVTAFEIRFEIELSSRWQKLQSEAVFAGKHREAVNGFFEGAESEVCRVVHEYFPRLLKVATAQRQNLGNVSPLAWTRSLVLKEVCSFLGVDEKFDHTAAPREDNRLVVAAVHIALGVGRLDEAIPPDFVLPGWLGGRWIMRQALLPARSLRSEDTAESVPPLSRAETIKWIKQKEFWMSKGLENQLENDSWDGVIDAAMSDVSVLDPFVPVDAEVSGKGPNDTTQPHEYSFVKEVGFWSISFGANSCRVQPIIGLDYISVLLENPGKPIRALELLTVGSGQAANYSVGSAVALLDDGDLKTTEDDLDDQRLRRGDFDRHEVVDDKARHEIRLRLKEIPREIVYFDQTRDTQKADQLREEQASLESYLRGSQNVRGRSRSFPNKNDKARVSITNALGRAYKLIGKRAPETAAHLKANISTGSEFMYRDCFTPWNVRRTP